MIFTDDWFSRQVDRHIDELTTLKHEKLEIEKRLRRLKIEKSNQLKKPLVPNRDKDLNSSDNESPVESDQGELIHLCFPFVLFSSFRIDKK